MPKTSQVTECIANTIFESGDFVSIFNQIYKIIF